MIDQICRSKRIVKKLRAGPLGPHLARLADHIAREHEQQGDARRILLCAGRFASFAEGRGQGTDEWDDAALVDFLLEGDVTTADAFHASDVRAALCEVGLMEGNTTPTSQSLCLLADFAAHLRDVRGLSLGVQRIQTNTLRRLLAFHREKYGELPLGSFTGKDALDLFQRGGALYRSVSTRQKFAAELRQILRFLHLRGHIELDLAATVPLFINYRLSTVPAHLPWEDVRRLITSIDTAVAPGKRDRAILLLIAGLGLRPGTVRALTLDQVFWREAELRIPRTKSRRGINLPLTEEVGQALSTYVLEERPKTELRTVFLRHTRHPTNPSPAAPPSPRSSTLGSSAPASRTPRVPQTCCATASPHSSSIAACPSSRSPTFSGTRASTPPPSTPRSTSTRWPRCRCPSRWGWLHDGRRTERAHRVVPPTAAAVPRQVVRGRSKDPAQLWTFRRVT